MKVNPANPLLARDYVGGSKPTTRDLPGSHFSYGKPDIKDPEGVAEVSRSWKYHAPTPSDKTDRDFKELNKRAIKEGAVTATQTRMNRQTHMDIKMKGPKLNKNIMVKLPGEDFTYGKPAKPSTPIHGVIGNSYGEESNKELEFKYQILQSMPQAKKLGMPKHTKGSKLSDDFRATSKKVDAEVVEKEKKPFKMTKWGKVERRTHTNRKVPVGKSQKLEDSPMQSPDKKRVDDGSAQGYPSEPDTELQRDMANFY